MLAGEMIVDDTRCLACEIPNLVQGNVYFVCVRAWNMKGFGQQAFSTPTYAIPSSKSSQVFLMPDIDYIGW